MSLASLRLISRRLGHVQRMTPSDALPLIATSIGSLPFATGICWMRKGLCRVIEFRHDIIRVTIVSYTVYQCQKSALRFASSGFLLNGSPCKCVRAIVQPASRSNSY
jgi:hypothetical protein